MARLLIRALQAGGHDVEIASEFRSYAAVPEAAAAIEAAGTEELDQLRLRWSTEQRPELWFCYHPYYKSPDLFGPVISTEFAVPYVTAEASYSRKRDGMGWAGPQTHVEAAIRQAAVNISFTDRDRAGMEEVFPEARFAKLEPFIDTTLFEQHPPAPDRQRLIVVAMMRLGDKMASYRMLAAALRRLEDRPWTLAVVGDGPLRSEVEALFSGFASGRIEWLGERGPEEVAAQLGRSGLYVWPGCGEAYGLAYLEAQAAGLPVVAQKTAGVPSVVKDGVTGILAPDGDIEAYAAAIGDLLENTIKRDDMAAAARSFVLGERSLTGAATALDGILQAHTGTKPS